MSKKHFIALADLLRHNKPVGLKDETGQFAEGRDIGRMAMWARMVEVLADFCQEQNHQFNRERWLDYIDGKCGPNGGAIKTKAA